MNHSEEFGKNAEAMRELNLPPAAFTAVRARVLGEIRARQRRKTWWICLTAAAAACATLLFVTHLPSNPPPPAPIVARKDPPKIEWTPAVVHRVHHTSSGRYLAQARPVRKTEPLAVVKMLTDDPNVIIIWLVDQKGDSL
ncbi:MAG TPA: hypothetical protein VKT81_13120 [Bryobacteraceae bacterium]|nr:hypothetical protein [Bryobacteraceae bacterium]